MSKVVPASTTEVFRNEHLKPSSRALNDTHLDLTTIVMIIRQRERQINFETVVVFFCVLTAYVIVFTTILSFDKDMK